MDSDCHLYRMNQLVRISGLQKVLYQQISPQILNNRINDMHNSYHKLVRHQFNYFKMPRYVEKFLKNQVTSHRKPDY